MSSNRRSMRLMSRIGIAVIFAIGMMVPLVASAHTDVSNGKLKNFQHVFIIMMENTSYSSLIGNPNAPWINLAAKTYGLATNYSGVTHPSQPNYIAATSGSTNGVTNDNDITINVPNIVDQIEAKRQDVEGIYAVVFAMYHSAGSACGNQLYERKHNPFISYLMCRVIRHVWQRSWTLASSLPTWQIIMCLTTPGSAPTSAMICMGVLQLRAIPATSPKCRA